MARILLILTFTLAFASFAYESKAVGIFFNPFYQVNRQVKVSEWNVSWIDDATFITQETLVLKTTKAPKMILDKDQATKPRKCRPFYLPWRNLCFPTMGFGFWKISKVRNCPISVTNYELFHLAKIEIHPKHSNLTDLKIQ